VIVTDASGIPLPRELAVVTFSNNVDDQNALQLLSGPGGFITLAVQLEYVSDMNDPRISDMHLVFIVDGVHSAPSPKFAPGSDFAQPGLCTGFYFTEPVRHHEMMLHLPRLVWFLAVHRQLPLWVPGDTPVDLPPIRVVDGNFDPIPGVEVILEAVSRLDATVFPHVPSALFSVTNNNFSSNSSGVVVFTEVTFNAPANSSMPIMIYSPTHNCYTEAMFVTVMSVVASLQYVDPAALTAPLSCPAPGSNAASLASCGCANRSALVDLGEVQMGVAFPITLFASAAGGIPLVGTHLLPVLNEVPEFISTTQYAGGSFSTSANSTHAVVVFGAFTGLPPFLTVTFPLSGSDSNGLLTVWIAVGQGYPGFYSLVFGMSASAVTRVIGFSADSQVGSLQIVRQPAAATAAGARVGDFLAVQPIVQVLDTAGNPLEGYQVNRCATRGVFVCIFPMI
jgi:hypothetical protein